MYLTKLDMVVDLNIFKFLHFQPLTFIVSVKFAWMSTKFITSVRKNKWYIYNYNSGPGNHMAQVLLALVRIYLSAFVYEKKPFKRQLFILFMLDATIT